ncbi:MAG: Xaa-Pro aminopeptidase [Candidatus Delongbacteria bacterium]
MMLKEINFPKGFFEKNRKKLSKKLPDASVTFVLSSLDKIKNRDTFYRYKQDSNYFYLTGLELKRSVLAIYKYGGRTHEVLFRKVLDPTLEKWVGRNIPLEDIRKISGISDVRDIRDLDDFYRTVFVSMGMEKVFLYNEFIPDLAVPTYTQVFGSNLKNRFNFIKISPLNPLIDPLRRVKEEAEIKMIKRAIDITAAGLNDVLTKISTGISENECEGILLYNYLKHGSVQPAFLTISASGSNATVLHYEDNNKRSSKGDLILFDTGAEYKNYASDISRTLPVSKKYTPEQKKFYNIVLDASKKTKKHAKAGVKLSELQEITKDVLFRGLFDLKMVKEKKDLMNYYYHGVSHFMGLDTHDVGNTSEKLPAKSVITVEPGLYIAEKNIGIRLEDDILIKPGGNTNLSSHIPIEIEEIEDIMNKRK